MGEDDGLEPYIRDVQFRAEQPMGTTDDLPDVFSGSTQWWRWSGVPNTMASNSQHRRTALAALLGIPQPIVDSKMTQQTYSRACQVAWRSSRTRAFREGQLQQHMQQFVHGRCGRRGARSGGPYSLAPTYGQANGPPVSLLIPVAASNSQGACGSASYTDRWTLASGSTQSQHQIVSSAAQPNHAIKSRNYPNRGDSGTKIAFCPGARVQQNVPVQKLKAVTTAQANDMWTCLKLSASRLATCNMEKQKWEEGVTAILEDAIAAGSSVRQRCQLWPRPRFDAMEKEYQDHIMCCLDKINIGDVANMLFTASPSFRANAGCSCSPARDPGDTVLGSDLQDSAPTGLVNRAMLLLYVLMMAAAYYDGDNDSAKDLANSQRHSAILLTSALMSYHGMPPWPYPELLELATLLSNLKELELSGNLPSKPFPESCTSLAMACRLTRAAQQLVETIMAPEVTSSMERALRAEKQQKAGASGAQEQIGSDASSKLQDDFQALSIKAQTTVRKMEGRGEENAVMRRQEGQDDDGVGTKNCCQQEAEEAGAKAGTRSVSAQERAATEKASTTGRQVSSNTAGTRTSGGIFASHTNVNAGVNTVTGNSSGACSSSGDGSGDSTGHSTRITDTIAGNTTGAAGPREPLLNSNQRAMACLQEELYKMRVFCRHRVYYDALTRHLGLISSMPYRDWRAAGPVAFVEEYKRLAMEDQQASREHLARSLRIKRTREVKRKLHRNHYQQRLESQREREPVRKQRLEQKDEGQQAIGALASGAVETESARQSFVSNGAVPAASGDAADQLPSEPNESGRLDVAVLMDDTLDVLRCEVTSMLCNIVPWTGTATPNEHGAAGGTGGVMGPLESMFSVRPFEDGSLRWRPPADPGAIRCDLARMLLSACLNGQRALFRAVGDAALQLVLGATAAANSLLEPGILQLGTGSGELEYRREREIAGGAPVAVTLLGQPQQQPPCNSAGSSSGALAEPSISSLIQLVPVGDHVMLRAKQAAGRKISWWPLPPASAATAEHILGKRVQVLHGHLEAALAKDSVAVLECWGGRSTLAEAAQAIAQVHWAALRQRREQVLVFPLLVEQQQKDTAREAGVRMRSAYTYIKTVNKTVVSTTAATDSAVRLQNEDSEDTSGGRTDTAVRGPVEGRDDVKKGVMTSASTEAARSGDCRVTGGADFEDHAAPSSCSGNGRGAVADCAAAALANGCHWPLCPTMHTSVSLNWPILRHLHFNKELCRMLGLLPGQERILAKGILHLGLGFRNDGGSGGGGVADDGAAGGDAAQPSVLPGGPLLFTSRTRLTLVVLSLGVSGNAP
ncbi:hypothetical protein Vretimale_18851 [Volvox reticuliferus]|uniref:Uncharacterized protein n=1 Tax=Volvox reticuliferus TaxID=1737510 RepID=A0A8J4CTB9_9CHLO|nr:hypothetical protein Vretifemale_17234 [Volvox reticuliferus]GIM16250.1 hypothetical protein Vretimale_18851 [Volvox reticuliferus]